MREVTPATAPARLVVLVGRVGTQGTREGKPRPLLRGGGLTLIERAIASAGDAGFDEVIVVIEGQTDSVESHVLDASRRRGIPVGIVHNDRRPEGRGLLAARPAMDDELIAVVAVDRVVAPSLMHRIRQMLADSGQPMAVIDERNGPETHGTPGGGRDIRYGDGAARGRKVKNVGAVVTDPKGFDAIGTEVLGDPSGSASDLERIANAGPVRVIGLMEHEWWFDVETAHDYRRGCRRLIRAAGKPLDGTLAVRLNGFLSQRLITPALLTAYPRITPNHVTLFAFAVAGVAAVAFAMGAPVAGASLLALASVLDRSDGEVARVTYRSSVYGGFLDAVIDRAADGIVFIGVAIYLVADDRLGPLPNAWRVPLAISVCGAALIAHLLVSYTTAKATVDLGHTYRGTLLGGGKGRDRRNLILTAGGLAAAIEPMALLAAMGAIALLSGYIVGVRLRRSWWIAGSGARYAGVRCVVLDLDGTVADSMDIFIAKAVELLVDELGLDRAEATQRYLATTGTDFATQLNEIGPNHPRLKEISVRFEAEKSRRFEGIEIFADVIPALELLAEGDIPVMLCSSTSVDLVRELCERRGLLTRFTIIDGWVPGHDKSAQLGAAIRASGVPAHDALFVSDSPRDAEMSAAAGSRFVGLVRHGRVDLFAGSGIIVAGSLIDVARSVVAGRRSPVIGQRITDPRQDR